MIVLLIITLFLAFCAYFGGFTKEDTFLGFSMIKIQGSMRSYHIYETPPLDLDEFNEKVDGSMVFYDLTIEVMIPFSMYETKNQKNGECESPRVPCKTNTDCIISIPNIRVVKPGICKEISSSPKVSLF